MQNENLNLFYAHIFIIIYFIIINFMYYKYITNIYKYLYL